MKLKELLPIEDRIFSSFLNRNDIVWMNTTDVIKMAAPIPTHMSDKDWDALWVSLQINGMQDPLMITTDGTTMRLDAGNHRIRLFDQHNITKIPCLIKNADNVVVSPGNGTHIGSTI
jgi:hypothetical protein